jgi:hypothetical protein
MNTLTADHIAQAAADVPVTQNPTLSTNAFFTLAVIHNLNPWWVCKHMNIEIDDDYSKTKLWTWVRFGQTTTLLSDGRRIFIGGEHEDWYDPMFFIFNDVVVYDPSKNVYDLYRYPKDVFPPTDFHTATLVDNSHIWIIGNLGYQDERGTVTPVYRLDINTLVIDKVEVSGESPGWIWKHTAHLSESEDVIVVVTSGGSTWRLDVRERKWSRE